MRRFIAFAAFMLAACSSSNNDPTPCTDGGAPDAPVQKELVCAKNFCGTIKDKSTGATANCGSCDPGSQCGDNGIANVCGAACMPLTRSDGDGGKENYHPACDYVLGDAWWAGYAKEGLQFPAQCLYMDPDNCVLFDVPWPSNGVCSGDVCGQHYCCLNDPDAGINPLVPGAVANNDGGLP